MENDSFTDEYLQHFSSKCSLDACTKNFRKCLENTSCIRKTRKYIPQSALWISRLFIELANRDNSVCMTVLVSKDTVLEDSEQKEINLIIKLAILIFLMTNRLANNEFICKLINESELTIEFSLRLFILRLR